MNDRHCPDHGNPDNPIEGWSHCLLATEDDPGTETCHWLMEEMKLRIKEITEDGNYIQLLPWELGGPRMTQEYRNHEKHGEPKPI